MAPDEPSKVQILKILDVHDPLPDEVVSIEKLDQTYELLHQATGSDFIGWNFGAQFDLDAIGVVGYLMKHAASFSDFMKQHLRYWKLIGSPLVINVLENNQQLELEFMPDPRWTIAAPYSVNQEIEGIISFLCKALTELTRQPLKPLWIELQRSRPNPCPGSMLPYLSYIRFGAPRYAIGIARQVADTPIYMHNELLLRSLEQYSDKLLAQLEQENDIVRSLKTVLMQHSTDQLLTLEEAAAALNVSARTLQRKLREAQTTFNKVLNELKIEIAKKWLKDDKLSVAEIAFLLGYNEVSSFQRFFKKMTANTPGAFKQQQIDLQ